MEQTKEKGQSQSKTLNDSSHLAVNEYSFNRIKEHYIEQVKRRGYEFKDSYPLNDKIRAAADFLTKPTGKLGIYIAGTVGNGKTTLVRAIKATISDLVIKGYFKLPNGEDNLFVKAYEITDTLTMEPITFDLLKKCCTYKFVTIDDVGTEPAEIQRYGNIITPITRIVECRYDEMLPTIITSNISDVEFGKRYGGRAYDRLIGSYLYIPFIDGSYR